MGTEDCINPCSHECSFRPVPRRDKTVSFVTRPTGTKPTKPIPDLAQWVRHGFWLRSPSSKSFLPKRRPHTTDATRPSPPNTSVVPGRRPSGRRLLMCANLHILEVIAYGRQDGSWPSPSPK